MNFTGDFVSRRGVRAALKAHLPIRGAVPAVQVVHNPDATQAAPQFQLHRRTNDQATPIRFRSGPRPQAPNGNTTSSTHLTEPLAQDDSTILRDAEDSAIVLIDPRALFRDCLGHCLQQAYDDQRVVSYGSVADWTASAANYPPAVVLMSVPAPNRLRGDGSMEASLSKLSAEVPVIIISESDDPARILDALKGGARGYIPTSLALAVAVEAVRLVEAGGTFVPVSTLLDARRATSNNGNVLFTPRQIMVMEALHRGKANKQIAIELNMRESTVKVHVRHIMKKLKAKNRTEVAVLTSDLFDPPGASGSAAEGPPPTGARLRQTQAK